MWGGKVFGAQSAVWENPSPCKAQHASKESSLSAINPSEDPCYSAGTGPYCLSVCRNSCVVHSRCPLIKIAVYSCSMCCKSEFGLLKIILRSCRGRPLHSQVHLAPHPQFTTPSYPHEARPLELSRRHRIRIRKRTTPNPPPECRWARAPRDER